MPPRTIIAMFTALVVYVNEIRVVTVTHQCYFTVLLLLLLLLLFLNST